MKHTLFISILLGILLINCSVSRPNTQPINKFEIIKIDDVGDHIVFKTLTETKIEKIILAEKDSVKDCRPFKKFIIADSIHETTVLKSGNTIDIVGFNLSTINGIKIRNNGELVKIIWNCKCFAD